jgi:hypothetical protein
MFKKSLIMATLLTVTSYVAAGELNVQGGSSTGGNGSTIVGRSGQLMRFSVTGAFNDVATVSTPAGQFARLSVRDLATLPASQIAPLIRYSAEKLHDGQTRVLLGVPNASPVFNGGNVTLRRGTAVIDSDPIVVR